MWLVGFSLWHVDFFNVACRPLVVALGSSSPTRGRTPGPCIGSTESYLLDHQGSPKECCFVLVTITKKVINRVI